MSHVTLVGGADEPQPPVSATTTTGGSATVHMYPQPPAGPVVTPAVAVEDIRAGDAAELVVDPHTGRGTVRRRRG